RALHPRMARRRAMLLPIVLMTLHHNGSGSNKVRAKGLFGLPLAHPRSGHACSHGSFVAQRVGGLWTERTSSAYNEMRLYVICLKDFPGKGNSILLAKLFAGADVNINFAILRP